LHCFPSKLNGCAVDEIRKKNKKRSFLIKKNRKGKGKYVKRKKKTLERLKYGL
jgi:hypothetical protein